jgi:NAD(P)H-hydrate epimerase
MALLSNNEQLIEKNKVWDADALNWLAENPDYDEKRVLTPHPGEAARLLGISVDEINQDRFDACESISQKFGGVCVLKGAGTIISDVNGMQIVCAVGNPGMATGGMGDVLSGIIGGLLAQGYSLLDAASLGVCIHGEAAELAAGKRAQYRGMLAGDLFRHFPVLLNP